MNNLVTLDLSEANIVEGGYKYKTHDNVIGSIFFDSSDCKQLSTIVIPNTVEEIRQQPFQCNNLESIIVKNENPYFSDNDGILFNKEQTTLILCPRNTNIKFYTVPQTVTTILHYAFNRCKNIVSIDMPYNVKEIAFGNFVDCDELTTVTMSNSVTDLGSDCFKNCEKLANISLSNKITHIKSCFSSCPSLKSIVFPEGVTSILYSLSLDSISIPSTVKEMAGVFSGQELYCHAQTPPKWENGGIGDEESNPTLYIPKGTYNAYWLAKGWGDFKNIVEMEEEATTANESISAKQDSKITPSMNGLEIETATPMEIYVCNFNGKTVLHKTVNGNESIQLLQGLYIVKIGGQTTKVLIK